MVLGLLVREKWLHIAEEAFKGGPLGELVQWSDTITSLFHLGYDVEIIIDYKELQSKMFFIYKNRNIISKSDLIFTDYYGIKAIYLIKPKLKLDNFFKYLNL